MALLKKIALLSVLVLCLISCKKEYNAIGLSLEDELLGTTMDTTAINAYSVLYDTLSTTNLSNQHIGALRDPIFGRTDASVYSQFRLSGSTPYFGESPFIDSVVLTLQISSYYGDTSATLNFSVYELSEDLSTSATYYNYSTTSYHNNNLLDNPGTNYQIHPNSSVSVNGEILSPHMRIRLKPGFGQQIMDESDNWLSDDAILADFKGLYIKAESSHSTGCLFSCNMTSSLTGLVIYYHNSTSNGLSYTFRPSSAGITYNNFNHYGYVDACQDLKRQIIDHDTTNISKLYLQPLGGVRAKVRFPSICSKFAAYDNHVVINRAELVISNCNPNESMFYQPSGLSIQGVKNDGSLYYLPDDEMLSADGFFGGTYNASTGEYRIRITKYIQQLILNQGNYANYFYLTIKGSGIHPNRLVFHSNKPEVGYEGQQLRLEIAYTIY